MFHTISGRTFYTKPCLRVVSFSSAVAATAFVVAAVLVLSITLRSPDCGQECRSGSLVSGLILLGFAVVLTIAFVVARTEMCKLDQQLAKRVIMSHGKEVELYEVRDAAQERALGPQAYEDSRHFFKFRTRRTPAIIPATVLPEPVPSRVNTASVPVGTSPGVYYDVHAAVLAGLKEAQGPSRVPFSEIQRLVREENANITVQVFGDDITFHTTGKDGRKYYCPCSDVPSDRAASSIMEDLE